MPLIDGSSFIPDGWYKNGHYNTFIPALILKNPPIRYQRQRWITPDQDFIDVDFSKIGSRRAAVILHGLEGNSSSGYVLHFADYFNRHDWDVVAPNYRGCSGEMNKKLQMYHSGSTGDIDFVLQQIIRDYDEIMLIGFSLGGNLVLKYLGEETFDIDQKIRGGIAISAPIDLHDASIELLKWENFAYQLKFLQSLGTKIWKKKRQFPEKISITPLFKTYNLYRFDEYFTAPIFGYKDARDYYDQNSSLQFIPNLKRPCLLVNAMDDPFLGVHSYPQDLALDIDHFYYCEPTYGGHVGFAKNAQNRNWLKELSLNFINDHLKN